MSPQHRGSGDGRVIEQFPLGKGFVGANIQKGDLEPQPSEAMLLRRALVCSDGHPGEGPLLALLEEELLVVSVESAVEEDQVLTQVLSVHQEVLDALSLVLRVVFPLQSLNQ